MESTDIIQHTPIICNRNIYIPVKEAIIRRGNIHNTLQPRPLHGFLRANTLSLMKSIRH